MKRIVQTAGRNALNEFSLEFAHFNDDVLFGENWNNQDIDLKTRSIITVVALMSSGITDSSLIYHLQNAKAHGVTQKEIAAIITHVAFYVGWPKGWAVFHLAKEVWQPEEGDLPYEDAAMRAHAKSMVFPIGQPNDAFAEYFVGQSYLAPISTDQIGIFNVTFEPGCRNNWHIHHAKSGGGQILVCVAGRGFYQEEGKEAVEMKPGDCINIPAEVKHWHGATPDEWFSHLAIEVPGVDCSNEWCEAVSEKEYARLKAGTMHDWTLDESESEKIIKHALNLGYNFFDTANGYSAGTSEEYLGRALKKNIARDQVVIASKVYFNEGRLSRKAIMREIDGSLSRLGTDYLDLYIIHRFDYDTPIEETMEALNELVKSGKVRALGASAMYGYQFYNMQVAARNHGWTPFSAMENHYNLLYREDERELIPICKQMNVSLMPYSPLAAGHLARPQWKSDSLRGTTDRVAMGKYDKTETEDMKIVKRVAELAEKYDCKMSQIAIAWQWAKGIVSPIIGATKTSYLDDAAGAFNIKLTAEDIAYLEEPYVPHKIIGAIDKNPKQGVVLLDEKK